MHRRILHGKSRQLSPVLVACKKVHSLGSNGGRRYALLSGLLTLDFCGPSMYTYKYTFLDSLEETDTYALTIFFWSPA